MSYLKNIHANYDYLTKSEKKVADYVVSSQEKIIHRTMNDIKKATMIGDATIIRFCQKIGYNGFSDLKIAVAKEGFHSIKTTEISYIDRIEEKFKEAIFDTRQLVNEEMLNQAVTLIHEANRVFVFGVGASGITALDMESRFLRSGLQVKAVIDTHYQAMNAALLTEKDLVIALSLTGNTQDLLDSLVIAKNNGSKIIAISNYVLSPIAQIADQVIQTAIEEYLLNGGSFSGKVSQLFAIDLFITHYEMNVGINELQMREKVARSVINKQIK